MAWLLDSDAFIQAKNLHYGFDFCPAFWDWMEKENRAERLYSIERVNSELLKGDEDELYLWAVKLGNGFFLPQRMIPDSSLRRVTAWVEEQKANQRYEQSAVNEFLSVADFHLIAHALAENHTVVTHEKSNNSKRMIQIPDVCFALEIDCVDPFEMLRSAKARFVLGTT
ncbi:MAG: DUF4411 family protein [Anaerolineaceae bacterium]|nr:DUF4411 family protein [Anaerolineaceae bacterium]